MTTLDEYRNSFETIRFERDDGILQMTVHTDGDSLRWGAPAVQEMQAAFGAIAADVENRVVIFTGTGEEFNGPKGSPETFPGTTARGWEFAHWNTRKLLLNFLDIEAPVICALNGPVWRHCETPLLSDIVIASETAAIQDSGHFINGLVPGDGMHIVLPYVMGPNRARYFMLTGQVIEAREALELGIFAEVLPPGEVLPRAWELARDLAAPVAPRASIHEGLLRPRHPPTDPGRPGLRRPPRGNGRHRRPAPSRLHPGRPHVNLALSEDQEDLQATFRTFFRREVSGDRVRSSEPLGFDEALWKSLVELGAVGVGVATERGGSGGGMVEAALLAEQSGGVVAPVPFVDSVVVTRLLDRLGNDAATELLGGVLAGDVRAALAPLPADHAERVFVPAGAVVDVVIVPVADTLRLLRIGIDIAIEHVENTGSQPWARGLVTTGGGQVLIGPSDDAHAKHATAIDEWRALQAAALVGLASGALAARG